MNYTSWLATLQEFKFTGKEWDSSKGQNLYDFGAWTYDPALFVDPDGMAMGDLLYESNPKEQEERGSEAGAFRHVLWQATITNKYGEKK